MTSLGVQVNIKKERDSWFTQIWDFVGEKQKLSKIERRAACYPEELPRRLIKMFSIIGDTILDPFLGTGTTTKVAVGLQRNSIGYEIDRSFEKLIRSKLSMISKHNCKLEFLPT